MTDIEQRYAAKKFSADWKDNGYEKGASQPFWLALLRNVMVWNCPQCVIATLINANDRQSHY